MPRQRRIVAGFILALALAAAFYVPVVAAPVGTANAAPTVTNAKAPDTGETDFFASLQSSENEEPDTKEAPIYVTIFRFVLSLALVLGLAYATILGLKRFTGLKTSVGAGRQSMRVVENASLGANRALHIVQIGRRRVVLASTPNQVNLITEIGDEDLPEPPAAEPVAGFKDQLALFLGSKPDVDKTTNNVAQMMRESTSFIQDRIGHLGAIRRRLRDA